MAVYRRDRRTRNEWIDGQQTYIGSNCEGITGEIKNNWTGIVQTSSFFLITCLHGL